MPLYEVGDVVWGFRGGACPVVGSTRVDRVTRNQIRLADRVQGFNHSLVVSHDRVFPTKKAALEHGLKEIAEYKARLLIAYGKAVDSCNRFQDELRKEEGS